ncbi:hypothetical protein RhiirA5_423928 [Rhizophagus irregularis]|uniref:Uncharacterized protein n=1 Tax=Rhizophagus irregularis TaxID=588596 RepID=A0A2I1EPH4_9GLOM|nr:hypothetical protein RhiirA5_423928 [Rhizophagus irregularis]PKY24028.1 hypothetical protein RhiirB3_387694 [Rhizophagus irregularis]CAB5206798.1 unnamed protein product [Rhizophagus irregularis]CAB5378072.1 unnamed protein product [Rhizophagus irregularis]
MMQSMGFFHYIPYDDCFYHITYQIVPRDTVFSDDHCDHGFFYYDSEINYYIKCKLISHPWIVSVLNRELYGIYSESINLEQKNPLSLNQKLNLEQVLKQFLPSYFMKNHIIERRMKTSSNKNMNSMTDNHNNSGNQDRFYQNRALNYNYNVTHQQPDSFHGNIGNNVMVSSPTSMPDNQNNINGVGGYIQNVIPQQQINVNNMSLAEREMRPGYESSTNLPHGKTSMIDIQSNCLPHQNRTEDTQQQVDFNNFPQHQIPVREMRPNYDINTNSPQNHATAYDDVSTTDINLNHHADHTRAYSQRQSDLNSLSQHYTPEEENNNVTIATQGILTADNHNYNRNGVPYNINQDVNINSSTTSN